MRSLELFQRTDFHFEFLFNLNHKLQTFYSQQDANAVAEKSYSNSKSDFGQPLSANTKTQVKKENSSISNTPN